jgi:hypothetical protein
MPSPRREISIVPSGASPGLVDDFVKDVEDRVGERQARGHRDPHRAFEEKEEESGVSSAIASVS